MKLSLLSLSVYSLKNLNIERGIITRKLSVNQNQKSETHVQKMMKKKTIDDSTIWSNLPLEIIAHVLSRLPVKSLSRFKCVSPSWNSLISSPQFSKTHLHIANTTNKPQKTILQSSSYTFYTVDFADENSTAKEHAFLSAKHSTIRGIPFWGSCNGLVLARARGTCSELVLLNPLTSECKELPKSPFAYLYSLRESHVLLPGLGYDSYTDDYKVVVLDYDRYKSYPMHGDHDGAISTYVAVYSLKTDAWRRIQDTHYVPMDAEAPGVHFNERVHWLCRRTGGLRGSILVAFNSSDEIFREMPWPAFVNDHEFLLPQMTVLGGCLSVIASQTSNPLEVWMMKTYGVRESWTKFSIANPGRSIVDVLYLTAKEVVLNLDESESDTHKLVVYDPRKETLSDMVVSGIPTRFVVGNNYIETLVSPNHGGRIWRQHESILGESSKSYQLITNEHPNSNPAN